MFSVSHLIFGGPQPSNLYVAHKTIHILIQQHGYFSKNKN